MNMSIRYFGNAFNKQKISNLMKTSSLAVASLFLFGCESSSSDTDENGYLKFYNASLNAPEVRIMLTKDDESSSYGTVEYGESTSLHTIASGTYNMELEWQEGNDDYNSIYEQDILITDDDVDLVVLTGDFDSPQILTFEYIDEDTELYDETDEDDFSLRVINVHKDSAGIDLYMSAEDETFNEAAFIGSVYYGDISANHYKEVEEYKIYITETGSSEVVFETNEINFSNNQNYVISVRQETGPSQSPYAIDILVGDATLSYSDKNSGAELRVYNGLVQHQLLPEFVDSVDVEIYGVEQQELISDLARGSMSETYSLPSSDYSLDIYPAGVDVAFAENHFVSLDSNDDKSAFVYLNEVTEENDDGEDETSVYVNTLIVPNSDRISLYDHQITVINLVQDEEFS
ncbi:MAG: hypothetical protein OQJ89_16730, partial [Kangiellaceae bacterium]|nr:hypothetical protein [Kangiellaceae bacterium]